MQYIKIIYLRTVFWFDLKSGGSVGHTAGVINSLRKKVKLKIISNDKLENVQEKVKIVKPAVLKYLPMGLGEFLYSLVIFFLLKKLTKQYDAIYQRYSGLSFGGALLSKFCNVPLILEFNSSDLWKLYNWNAYDPKKNLIKKIKNALSVFIKRQLIKKLEAFNLKEARSIVVVSKVLKENLIRDGVESKKILVNPNGVDTDKYSPNVSGKKISEKYKLKGKKVIGFIGTFGQWHGILEMTQAIVKFYKSNPGFIDSVVFLLVGDGLLKSKAENMIQKFGLNNQVIFTGLVSHEEGPYYLAACDILLSPHIKNPDGSKFFGSPTKLFEYMAMGKPIIASKLDQIGETLNHLEDAYLVKPGNIIELVNAIIFLLNNDQLCLKIGNNARKKVIENYTWDIHTERILSGLKDVRD